jgi:cell division protein FtsB
MGEIEKKGWFRRRIEELIPHAMWHGIAHAWEVIRLYIGASAAAAVIASVTAFIQRIRHNLDISLILTVFVVSLLVLIAAMFGTRHRQNGTTSYENDQELESELRDLKTKNADLQQENQKLHASLKDLTSLKLRVWGLLNEGILDVHSILRVVGGKQYDDDLRRKVDSVLGILADERKIEPDTRGLAGSFRLVR